jgi:hypothetical protein
VTLGNPRERANCFRILVRNLHQLADIFRVLSRRNHEHFHALRKSLVPICQPFQSFVDCHCFFQFTGYRSRSGRSLVAVTIASTHHVLSVPGNGGSLQRVTMPPKP